MLLKTLRIRKIISKRAHSSKLIVKGSNPSSYELINLRIKMQNGVFYDRK